MYNVKCKVCGSDMTVENSRYCYCGDDCRLIGYYARKKEYDEKVNNDPVRRKMISERAKFRTRIINNGTIICRICRKPIYRNIYEPETIRNTMHTECILDEAIGIVKSGQTLPDKIRQRAYSRGYDINMIKEIIETGERY